MSLSLSSSLACSSWGHGAAEGPPESAAGRGPGQSGLGSVPAPKEKQRSLGYCTSERELTRDWDRAGKGLGQEVPGRAWVSGSRRQVPKLQRGWPGVLGLACGFPGTQLFTCSSPGPTQWRQVGVSLLVTSEGAEAQKCHMTVHGPRSGQGLVQRPSSSPGGGCREREGWAPVWPWLLVSRHVTRGSRTPPVWVE